MMSRVSAAGESPVQEQPRSTRANVFASLIADAYQAECERFDAEMESADGEAGACRHNLLRAAGTPRMRALVERLIEAEEKAAAVRYEGFFAAGIAAGIEITVLAGLRGRRDTDDDDDDGLCGQNSLAGNGRKLTNS